MKILKIILINFLLLALTLVLIDFCIYQKYAIAYKKDHNEEQLKISPLIKYFDNYKGWYGGQTIQQIEKISFRNNITPFEKERKKGSIIFIGCSYTYGEMLNDDEILSYLIYKKTNRNVLNFGLDAGGLQHFYYLINKKSFIKNNIPKSIKPEYVFYTYIPSHIIRLNSIIYPQPLMVNGYNIRYKLKNNTLQLQKPLLPSFFYKTFIVKSFLFNNQMKIDNKNNEIKYKNFELFNELLLESREILRKYYPNIKFIILRYKIADNNEELMELPFMWDVLKAEGFIILDTEELIGRRFEYDSPDCAEDKYHPSAQSWEMLTPKIIEKLNL